LNRQIFTIHNVIREVFSRAGVQNAADRFLVLALLALTDKLSDRNNLEKVLKQHDYSCNVQNVLNGHLSGVWRESVERLGKCESADLADAAVEAYRHLSSGELRDVEFTSPGCVIDLVVGLLSLADGDSFVDLGCGIGGMLLRVASGQRMPAACCTGLEINQYAATVAELRIRLDGLGGVAINPDGGHCNVPANSGDMFAPKNYRYEKYDKVVCVPPFGTRSHTMRVLVDQFLKTEHPLFSVCGSTLDWVFVARALSSMDDGGRAVVILPAGAMFSKTELPARRYFIDREAIEAVVALPERIFRGTSIRTCAVVLRKGSKSVKMIDASRLYVDGSGYAREMSPENVNCVIDLFEGRIANADEGPACCKSVSHKDITAHGFDLSPSAYSAESESFANDVRLGEIIDVRRGTPLSANRMKEHLSETATQVRFLSFSDIDDDGMVDVSALPYLKEIPEGQEQFCAVDGDLLVSRVGATCKSAVIRVPAGEKVICSSGLYVCSVVKDRVDAHYVKAFLESPVGRKRLERIMRGTVQQAISIADFKALRIPLEPMDVQRQIGEHYRAAQDDVSVLKRKLVRARDAKSGVFGEYVKEP